MFQMSLTWIICGAGRGVGKTTVALRLCDILPDSIYAKCGHGKARPEKNKNYFSNIDDLESFIKTASGSKKHIIVESNSLAKSLYGDIVIFLDGTEGKTNYRSDTRQLQDAADIKICRDTNSSDWKKTLSAKISSGSICNAVCDLLLDQKRRLFGAKPIVRSKVWFEAAGEHIFGSGLASLMENINRTGTLREAARDSNMSYRHAWELIRTAEHHFGRSLLNRCAGGRFGGSSKLSQDGLHMLDVFKKLNDEVAAFTDEKFEELYTREKVNV